MSTPRQLRFNLELTDPIERHLPDDAPWKGSAGNYVVNLGDHSTAEPGTDASLPTLTASINAFTRLWLGIAPATGLAVTDTLAGTPDLLTQLDRTITLPIPQMDWDF